MKNLTQTIRECYDGTPRKPALKRRSYLLVLGTLFLLSVTATQPTYANSIGKAQVEEGESHDPKWNTADADSSSHPPGPNQPLSSPEAKGNLSVDSRHVLWYGDGIWISDIGTLLYRDRDRDGYFSSFSLSIDADTHYSHADVYVDITLEYPNGQRELLHSTGVFSLYGISLSDDYRVEIDLVKNYPIGNYDLTIDLIDANNHQRVDTVSARDWTNLAALPLEDEESDRPPAHDEPVTPSQPVVSSEIRVVEHGGATGLLVLLILTANVCFRRKSTHI